MAKKKTKKAKPPAKRPTITPDQVDQVFKWIIEGNSAHDITEAIANTFPGAPVELLIIAAGKQLRESATFDLELVAGWAIASTRELYRRMVAMGDYVGAMRAITLTLTLSEKYQDIGADT